MRYTKEMLEPIVLQSKSMSEVIRLLGLKQCGGNHVHLTKKIKDFGINNSHFLGKGWSLNQIRATRHTKEEFIEKILILDGLKWGSHDIKIKLYEFGLKEEKCEKCGQGNIWCNEKLGLELHHRNEKHNDNRIENLQILCPNCHAQENNLYKKKKNIIIKNKKIIHCECGAIIGRRATMCEKCWGIKQRKSLRPTTSQLLEDISNLGYVGTGKKYGVSDNAIRKWIKIK